VVVVDIAEFPIDRKFMSCGQSCQQVGFCNRRQNDTLFNAFAGAREEFFRGFRGSPSLRLQRNETERGGGGWEVRIGRPAGGF
jgi:hypothetical protein